MATENSDKPFLTSSQESMVLDAAIGLDLHALGNLLIETEDVKYDITQHLPSEQQHNHQHQMAMLPEFHLPLAQVPPSEEFAGPYNFQLDPAQQDSKASWVYSPKLNKVFIEMGKTLPIRIKWTAMCPGPLYVKAVMVFCQSAHRSEPVTRCHNHIALSTSQGMPHVNHILSCKHANSIYTEGSGHYSVLVPLGAPQPGSDSIQMDFMFHCKNSCTGVNRRPTEVVFNLENDSSTILGRRKLLVRICSCPKRDRDKEERLLVRDTYPPYPPHTPSVPKKRKLPPGKKGVPVYRGQPEPESEIFNLSCRIYGRENFEAAKRVIIGLMYEALERTGQQAIKPLIEEIKNQR